MFQNNNILRRIEGKAATLFLKSSTLFYKGGWQILMLHHIGEDPKVEFNISLPEYERLIKHLKGKVEPICEITNNTSSASKYVITIDDVPESFYENAYPLLKVNEMPFTIFVCYELINKPGYITTEQLKELANDELCTIGSHGMHHVFMGGLSEEDFDYELQESKKQLESIIGETIDLFAFPYGSFVATGFKFPARVLKYYKLGFSTLGFSYLPNNHILRKYYIPRINVTSKYIDNLIVKQ